MSKNRKKLQLTRIMKLTTFMIIVGLMQASASGFAQKVSLDVKNMPLELVLQAMKQQTKYQFVYTEDIIAKARPVNIHVQQAELKDVLSIVFDGQPLEFSVERNTIIIKEKESSFADRAKSVILNLFQDLIARGRILDENGKPLEGATVVLKGSNRTAKTDAKGEFVIPNVPDDGVLVIRYVGYKQLEVSLKDAVMPLEIKLNVATGELEEVKVVYNTGYQELNKERATGSFNLIDNQKFNEQVGTTVLTRLPAIASGLILLPGSTGRTNQLALRGVQTFTGPVGPLIVVDDFPYNGDINNINPNDIENVTLLKDAAAASIWGAKAGNGVIVITTKRGKLNQKVSVDVSSNVTVIAKPNLFYLKRAGTGELIEFEKFLFSNGYYDADLQNSAHTYQTPVIDILEKEQKKIISPAEAASQLDALQKNNLFNDVNKYIYTPGLNQQYAFTLRGGSTRLGWLLSAGFDKNRNSLDADYNRETFRFNNIYQPLKQLTVSAGIDVAYSADISGKYDLSKENNIPLYTNLVNGQGTELSVNSSYRQSFVDTAGHGKLLSWQYFPLQDYKHIENKTTIKGIIGNVGFNYKLLPGLQIDLKYRLQVQQQQGSLLNGAESFYTRTYINRFSAINNATQVVNRPVPLGGIMDINNREINSHNLRLQVNLDKTWGRHSLRGILGHELSSVVTDNLVNRYYGYDNDLKKVATIDYLKTYPLFIKAQGSAFIENRFRLFQLNDRFTSQYLNLDYTYNEKYILSASARKDGANLFGVETNDKWNLLWSVGAGWELSKEDFFKLDFLPYLKIKGTYGFGGNVLTTATSKTTLSYGSISEYTGTSIARVLGFLNPDLRWEKNKTINVGLDFRLKQERISGSVDYFRKSGSDLYDNTLIDRTLGLGRDNIQNNNGKMEANGLELSLKSINIDGNLRWISDLQLNYYKDKVTEFYTPSIAAYNFTGNGTPAKGYSRFSLFAYKWAGLNPQTGDPQGYLHGKPSTDYYALYGDSATIDDLSYKGSVFPKYYGSLGNTISYKDFSFTARISYAFDYYFQRTSFDYSSDKFTRMLHADFSERWKKPGDETFTDIPSLAYDEEGMRSIFYQNAEVLSTRGDLIRLQYLNLSYSLNRVSLPKLPFSNLRLSLIGNDLGILWKSNKHGIDPNAINSVPMPRSYVFSINANF